MLKMDKRIALACVALPLFMAACGKSKDKTTKSGAAIQETPADLRGAWVSPCLSSVMPGLEGVQREYIFNAIGDFDKIERYYSDSKCQTIAATYKTIGSVEAKGALTEDKAVQSINLTVNDAFLTMNTDNAVKTFNALKLCGRDNWAVNQNDSVINTNCGGALVKKGDVIFDVYSKSNENLFFGKTFLFLVKDSGDARPTTVNKETPYTKK